LATLLDWIDSAGEFWDDSAKLYMQRRPGCIAVEVLDPNYEIRSIVYAPEDQRLNKPLPLGGVPVYALKAAAESDGPVVSAGVPMDGRKSQRMAVVPIERHGEFSGFVVAFFELQRRFDSILADVRNLGFSMAILEGGREQYLMGGESKEDKAQPWSTETAQVAVPGVTWELQVWPNSATLRAINVYLPELALIVGAFISLLLASTLHFAKSARAQSCGLRQLNVELLEEGRHRQKAEEGLRHAQDELELRVQQRTMELTAAKAKLANEIVEHARAEESLQRLAGQLFQLQDEERRRLARELHDGTTQNLIAVAMNMASIHKRALPQEQRTELLEDSIRLIQQSIGELRTISHLLHPPLLDELGLPVTLRSYVDGFSARSGISVAVVLDPNLGRLNRDIELAVFRVVQESLANVHRHSHSDTASILLCREHAHIRLEISDAGTGISPEIVSGTERGTAGVGIAGMRERVRLLGGRLEVRSGNTGTVIWTLIPLMELPTGDQLG